MRKNLSQQKLLDVLTEETEVLRRTSQNIKEVAPEIARQLEELKNTKLKADMDTDKLEQLLKDHEQALQKKVVIPRWFLVLVWVVIVFLLAEVVWLLVM
jgi:ABC-type transporter Mla subunit MlaD